MQNAGNLGRKQSEICCEISKTAIPLFQNGSDHSALLDHCPCIFSPAVKLQGKIVPAIAQVLMQSMQTIPVALWLREILQPFPDAPLQFSAQVVLCYGSIPEYCEVKGIRYTADSVWGATAHPELESSLSSGWLVVICGSLRVTRITALNQNFAVATTRDTLAAWARECTLGLDQPTGGLTSAIAQSMLRH